MWLMLFKIFNIFLFLVNLSLKSLLWCVIMIVLVLFLRIIFELGFGDLFVWIWVSIWCLLSICLINILSLLFDFFCLNICVGIILVLLKMSKLFLLISDKILLNILCFIFFDGLLRVSKWLLVWFVLGKWVINLFGRLKLKLVMCMEYIFY